MATRENSLKEINKLLMNEFGGLGFECFKRAHRSGIRYFQRARRCGWEGMILPTLPDEWKAHLESNEFNAS